MIIRGAAAMFQLDEATLRAHPMVLVGTSEELVAAVTEPRERCGVCSCMIPAPTRELGEIFGKEIIPRLSG